MMKVEKNTRKMGLNWRVVGFGAESLSGRQVLAGRSLMGSGPKILTQPFFLQVGGPRPVLPPLIEMITATRANCL